MKRYFNLNKEFDVFHLIKFIRPIAFNLIDNGYKNFILGWTNDEDDIVSYDSSNEFFKRISNIDDFNFGYFGYDLKNDFLPNTYSENIDIHEFPESVFFKASYVIIKKNEQTLFFGNQKNLKNLLKIIEELVNSNTKNFQQKKISLIPLTSKEEYLKRVKQIKSNIQLGNTYELNYCTQFYAVDKILNVEDTYIKLRSKSKAPFSNLMVIKNIKLLSSSPERFLRRQNQNLISQPIKGTSKRAADLTKDRKLKFELINSEKERAENIMIVDLVRNDFSKIASKNSVSVKELCKLYSFPTVHQLISTVECKIADNEELEKILKSTFPMGSMTGAPKLKSVHLIDQFEDFKRGIYSGSSGYFSPNNSFDFNVVIRSILHNSEAKTISCSVGSAITIKSDPVSEYNECLVKLHAIQNTLN